MTLAVAPTVAAFLGLESGSVPTTYQQLSKTNPESCKDTSITRNPVSLPPSGCVFIVISAAEEVERRKQLI